mgnify:CR=1 FL=1
MMTEGEQGPVPGRKGRRLGLLAVAVACGAFVFVEPVSWRPEGGMTPTGLVLALSGVAGLIVAIIYDRWRAYPILAVACPAAFVALVFLHNAFYALRQMTQHWPLVPALAGVVDVGSFLAALFLCPAGLLVGLGGSSLWGVRLARRARNPWGKVLAVLFSAGCGALCVGAGVFLIVWLA